MKSEFFLVSVKPKNSQSQGQIYVVRREDISSFVETKLSLDSFIANPNFIILILGGTVFPSL